MIGDRIDANLEIEADDFVYASRDQRGGWAGCISSSARS